jgi:tetratricopeptide (TPR) repeat protein
MIRTEFLAVGFMALVLVSAIEARAQSIEDAQALFDAGEFVAAADAGAAAGTSDSFALAAESLAVYGYYVAAADEKQAVFERAIDMAEQAIAADAVNPEAHLQASHAMGRYAQTIGVVKALGDGYAGKVREAIDAALALNPDFMEAHLSLAAWNAEIVASAGFMADFLYGATEEGALKHYQAAYALALDQKGVGSEYASGLLLLDKKKYGEQARTLLEHDIALPTSTAYGELLHQRAVEKLAALDGE